MVLTFGLIRTPLQDRCFSKVSYLLTFCVLSILFGTSDGKSCTQDGLCKCKFDDGSGTVDLTPIGRNDGTPLMQDKFAPDAYAYSFNPCYPFTEGTCVNAAACQYDSNNNIYYNIGDSSKVTLSYDGLNVIGDYASDDGARLTQLSPRDVRARAAVTSLHRNQYWFLSGNGLKSYRSSKVTFQCDPNVDPPTDTASGETSQTVYEFTVISKHACPQGGDGPGPGPNPSVNVSVSISVGSVLVIVFFSVVIVYLVSGMVFNKFYRHNAGREVVPNVTLWIAIPGLIKEGVMFCVGKITRKGAYQKM